MKQVVEYLLEKNCIDINAKSDPGIHGEQFTALDIAMRWKHIEIIELLKQNGAQSAQAYSQQSLGLRR
jgi:ankyrin repeat protein